MVKAIIFDCFGVLTTDGWLAFCNEHFTPGTDAYERAHALNVRVDSGLISYDMFLDEIANLAGMPRRDTQRAIESNVANEQLFDYIKHDLKPRFQLGILSNAGDNWLLDLFQPWQVALFDEVVLSYQVHAAKPDAQMYQAVTSRLGLTPQDCVFIDDQPRYVQAAQACGMQGIVFTDTEQCMGELAKITENN